VSETEGGGADLAEPRALPPGVGARLKAERERQALSVADVAQRLKYAPRQIVAVEADDFAALPGLTFVRGFVRGYARLLGLPADPLVAALESSAGGDGGPTTVQLQSVMPTRATFPAGGAAPARALPWVLAMLAVVAALGGYSLLRWQAPAELFAAPPPGVPEQVVVPAPMEAQPAPAAPGAASAEADGARSSGGTPGVPAMPATAPAAEAVVAPAAAAQPLPIAASSGQLRLVYTGESWTEVRDADGRVLLSRNNAAGSEQVAEGRPPFEVVVGNARDVRLYYRGAEVDLKPHIKVSVARLTVP
jgi:cytoskeleton protein RodZ